MLATFDRWLARWLLKLGLMPEAGDEKIREAAMQDATGLPAEWFADEEVWGSEVRLLGRQSLGGGYALRAGECFLVAGLYRDAVGERWLCVGNQRADRVPVRDALCEVVFHWPIDVGGSRDVQANQ